MGITDTGSPIRAKVRRTLQNVTRDVILAFHVARPMSGASDAGIRGRSYVWIAPSTGKQCDSCGRRIAAGEVEYQTIVDGRQMILDRACYVRMQAGRRSSKTSE